MLLWIEKTMIIESDLGLIISVLFWFWIIGQALPIIWGFIDGFLDAISDEPFDEDIFKDNDDEISA